MLSIFICEDDVRYREQITEFIGNYIDMENLSMKVVCSTASPDDVLDYLSENKAAGLYFLDLDLGHEINGIGLAQKIRALDPRGFIVFITSDAESHVLTFNYKVEAMDYIVKNDFNLKDRICECIRDAEAKFTAKATPLQDTFVFKGVNDFKDRLEAVELSKILYFETNPNTHNIFLYTETSRHEFRGSLNKIVKDLDTRFIRCHRAIIVNADKITSYNKLQREIWIDMKRLDVAGRYVKKLELAILNKPHIKRLML